MLIEHPVRLANSSIEIKRAPGAVFPFLLYAMRCSLPNVLLSNFPTLFLLLRAIICGIVFCTTYNTIMLKKTTNAGAQSRRQAIKRFSTELGAGLAESLVALAEGHYLTEPLAAFRLAWDYDHRPGDREFASLANRFSMNLLTMCDEFEVLNSSPSRPKAVVLAGHRGEAMKTYLRIISALVFGWCNEPPPPRYSGNDCGQLVRSSSGHSGRNSTSDALTFPLSGSSKTGLADHRI